MDNKLKVLIIILAIWSVDVIFEITHFIPGFVSQEKKYWFLICVDFSQYNWDGKMTLENYVYPYCGHVSWLIVYAGARWLSGWQLFSIAFILEFGDMFFYALNYNFDWFAVGQHGVDFNDVKLISILSLIIIQLWKLGK